MGELKYVMFECTPMRPGAPVRLVPIIFPDFMIHADAEKFIGHWLRREHEFMCKPVSAGFFRPGMPSTTYGESETLKLQSRPNDAAVIDTYPYTHGVITPDECRLVRGAAKAVPALPEGTVAKGGINGPSQLATRPAPPQPLSKRPVWAPRASASHLPEGSLRYGSTGQLCRSTGGRWEHIENPTAEQVAQAGGAARPPSVADKAEAYASEVMARIAPKT